MAGTHGDWISASALRRSPEQATSTAFTDRPIRPLPTRRIRSRLSDEQADSIVFPPTVAASSPLFASPQSQTERAFGTANFTGDGPSFPNNPPDHHHFCDCGDNHSTGDSEEGEDNEDEDNEEEHERQIPSQRYSWPERTMKYPRRYETRTPTQLKSPVLNSSTSSADGYESFENTNNKKKRKIPISAALGQPLSSDVASMSIPTQSVDVSNDDSRDEEDDDVKPPVSAAHSTVSSGIGISGPGRGRYSRSVVRPLSERRPLSASTNALNAFSGASNVNSVDKGIISTAIANASETSQIPAPKGQENISLLQRQKQSTTVPQNFTFEYKSASSDKLASSRSNLQAPALPKAPAVVKPSVMPGMKQSPPLPSGAPQTQQTARTQGLQQPQSQPAQQALPKASKSRRPGQALRIAALRRKEQQRYENYVNPPKPEDTWVCEFCEYQSIFGQEPLALVRAYEQRERRERKERETNRKRLEQAKAKGRKGKKGKANQKHSSSNAANNMSAQNQRYDPRYDDTQEGDSQGEEIFDDEYEDSLAGPSPIEQEPNVYSSHEYPPPPPPPPPLLIGSIEDDNHVSSNTLPPAVA